MIEVIVTTPVWTLNGVNIFAASLARGLQVRGVPVRLLVTGVTYRDRKPMPLPRDVPVEHLTIPLRATWKARRNRLAQYIESRAPCIYLPNHDFLHSAIAASLSSRVAVVGVVHSDDAQHYEHARRMGPSWNAAVAVSATIARRLAEERAVDPARVSVIPYGVDAAETLPDRRQKTIRLLYAGRLDAPQKRVLDLVEIARLLERRGTDFEMTIVGDGPERASLSRLIADYGLGSRVRLRGTASNAEIIAMYRDFDAFVLPSAYEGMPIAVLEAMGQGCVPFATDIASGIPDLIEHGINGYSARVGDVGQFAELISAFASSSDRGEVARRAWRTVAAGPYTIDRMVSRYMEVFERVGAEAASQRFVRAQCSPDAPISIRDRLAAPLWALRPAMRGQQKLDR